MGKKNEDAAVQRNGLSLQSEDKFRAIFEGTNDGILVADAKTRKFILANSRICEITGYSQEGLLKLSVNSIHPKKDLPRVISEFTKLLQRKIITAKDIPVLRKNKGVVYCDINSKVVKIGGRECQVGFFRDTTERKQAEEKYKVSELHYRRLFEAAKDGILILDYETGAIVDVNPFLEQLSGYQAKEMLGKHLWEIGVFKDIATSKEDYLKLQAHGYIRYEDLPLRTKSGKKAQVEFVSNVYLVSDRKVIQCNIRDITERKKAEEIYRVLFEDALDAIFVADVKTGMLVNCNNAATKLVERKKSEIIGQHQSMLHPPEKNGGRFTRTFKKHMKEAEGRTLHGQVITKSGKIKDVEIKASIIEPHGKKFLQGIFRDITERKKAEEALRESEEKYRSMMELAPNGIISVDMKGIVTSCNLAFLKLTGYRKEQIVGKYFTKLPTLHMLDMPKYMKLFSSIAKGNIPEPFEFEWTRKDGSGRLGEIRIGMIKTGNKITGMQAFVKDITERKRMTALLQESERHLKEAQSLGRIGSWEFDVKKQTIIWSEETYVLYERDPKLSPPSPKEEARYYSAEQAKTLRDYASRAIETGKRFSYDVEAKFPSGRTAYLAATMQPVKDERGRVVKLFGTVQDITERMKVDEAVKQSEQKLSQIIQGSSVATFVIDESHKVIYWNSACKKLTGIPAERMIGKDAQWSAFYKEKRPVLADLIVDGAKESEINKLYEGTSRKSQVLQGAYEAERFLPMLGRSGRWLLFTAAPLKNSKGQITGAIETLQDITERKGVEEELKGSEERHRILYESSWDAIMTLAPPSWRFTSGNPATLKLFGARNEKEFITKGPWDVSPEYQPDGTPSSDTAKKAIEKAMKEGSNFFEWTHKKLSGEDFPASVLLTRMTIKDQTFLQATVRDITEQKKAEEELKSKVEELEKFNRLAVGRELKMIELKKRIEELEKAGK